MKRILTLLTISMVLFSCTNSGNKNQHKEYLNTETKVDSSNFMKQKVKHEPKDYFIKINCSDLGDRKVKIDINTNFPDGTILNCSVYRIFRTIGSAEEYIGEIDDKDIVILNGKCETIVNIIDTDWYYTQQELIDEIPNDFPPISNISENITVSIAYTSVKSQSDSITEILGSRGEFVTGDGVEKWGEGTAGVQTSLNVEKEFKIQFKK